ncbi:MAG: hypothetical protein WC080_00115 [Patescibacteria group bacterium]|jgi:putative protease
MANDEKEIGEVTHYFDHIGVAVIKFSVSCKDGDEVHFMGHGADFTQKVESMQKDHEDVAEVKKGDEVGMKVSKKVKEGTKLFAA